MSEADRTDSLTDINCLEVFIVTYITVTTAITTNIINITATATTTTTTVLPYAKNMQLVTSVR